MIETSRSVWTVLLLGFALSLTGGTWVYQTENQRIEEQFLSAAKDKVNALNLHINEGFAILDYLRFVVEESNPNESDALKRVFERIHHRNPLLEGIAWASLENRNNHLSLPILVMEPQQRYRDWIGADLALIPEFLENAQPVLSGRQQNQVLTIKTQSGRENQLTLSRTHSPRDDRFGLLLAALNIPALLEEAIGRMPLRGASIQLTLESVNLGQRSYRWPADELTPSNSTLSFSQTLDNPARIPIQVKVTPLPSYFEQRISFSAWLTGLCGAVLTLLVALHLNHQVRLRHQMERLSVTDALTGIANRRHFDQFLSREWQAARRSLEPISLLIIDIDYFKLYNDHYGHSAGDRCLEEVARLLDGVISRPRDLLARLGGEEFAVILPNTDQSAAELAERCRLAIEQAHIPHQAAINYDYLTLSIGCATLAAKAHQSPEALITLADQALYQAKDNGRNRVESLCSESPPPSHD